MDSISDSDSEDAGSIPAGATETVWAWERERLLRSHTHTPPLSLSVVSIKSNPVMFDFEKLDVYKKAKVFNSGLREFINITRLDSSTKNQLRRAAFSGLLTRIEEIFTFDIRNLGSTKKVWVWERERISLVFSSLSPSLSLSHSHSPARTLRGWQHLRNSMSRIRYCLLGIVECLGKSF